MLKTLTCSGSANLKSKLTLVYILNAIDIVFTFGLLKTGLFYEANVLMSSIVESAFLSIFVKLLLPAVLIIYILFRLDDNRQPNLRTCNFFICLVLFMYMIIDFLHLFFTFSCLILL